MKIKSKEELFLPYANWNYDGWSNLAKVVYKRTYARPLPDSSLENWFDTSFRTIEGNLKLVDEKYIEEDEHKKILDMFMSRKMTTAGRGLWMSGTEASDKLGATALNNPLHEDTKILTKEYGWIPLKEIEGQNVTVLSCTKLYGREKRGEEKAAIPIWVPATISNAEMHNCLKITFEDGAGFEYSIVSSWNHRWFKRGSKKTQWTRVSTEELKEGDYLPRVKPTKYFKPSYVGYQHGFFFGDGTRSTGELNQFTEDNILVLNKIFPSSQLVKTRLGMVVRHLPKAWGKIPTKEYSDNKYIYSFLAGYFAADGYIHKHSLQASICSARKEELESIKGLFWKIGVSTGKVKLDSKSSNYKEERELYRLTINLRDLTEAFFLKTNHLSLWKERLAKNKKTEVLKITKIEEVADVQRVLCATVPNYEQFVTEGYCLTSNCWFLTSDDWNNYVIAQDLLMLGGGVGMSVEHRFVSKLPKVKKGVTIFHKATKDADFIVPDSREGWCELTRKTLEAFFVTGKGFSFSTVCVRGAGEIISGFGGKASGPLPMIDFIANVSKILSARESKHLRPTDASDILCAIAHMVVAGNVRRSALMILGDPWDKEFLTVKRWDLYEIPAYRYKANFSVVADDYQDLHPLFWDSYNEGEPIGIFNRKNAQKFGRMGEKKKDNCIGLNPCVSGDTKILTKNGYQRIDLLVDSEIDIWNGFEWSKVTPKITGENQKLLKVKFSDGRELKCTPYHKFHLSDGYKGEVKVIEAKDLKLGDKLIKHTFPVIKDGSEASLSEMYTQGFYSADGIKNSTDIWLYEPKWGLEVFMDVRKIGKDGENPVGVKRRGYRTNFETKPKDWIPDSYGYKERLAWLSGLMDGDGCELNEGGSQIASINKEFLLNVQKMLTTLGVNSKVLVLREEGKRFLPDQKGGVKEYFCQKCYRLCIGSFEIQELKLLGLDCKRLKFQKDPNRSATQFTKVTSIEELGSAEFVYCFNEPLRHLAVFDGVITGQCAEATLEDGEPCNLLEQYLSNITSIEEWCEAARLATRMAIRTTCGRYHHPKSAKVIAKNRRIGIGITGILGSPLFTDENMDIVYKVVSKTAEEYCAELGIPNCIKLTVIKPSGTVSKVGDCLDGCHPAYSRYLTQRVRFASNDSLIPLLKAAGHNIEMETYQDGSKNPDTVVVDFYLDHGPDTPCADSGFDTWKQLDLLLRLQRYWADQAVSITVYYKKEEIGLIKDWVAKNLKNIKSISFLLHTGHGFVQAPKEPITKEQYEELSANVRPISIGTVGIGKDLEDSDCGSGACPVK